jgi:hypothetical protein
MYYFTLHFVFVHSFRSFGRSSAILRPQRERFLSSIVQSSTRTTIIYFEMDVSEAVAFVVGISVATERLLETLSWSGNILGNMMMNQKMIPEDEEKDVNNWKGMKQMKMLLSIILGPLVGWGEYFLDILEKIFLIFFFVHRRHGILVRLSFFHRSIRWISFSVGSSVSTNEYGSQRYDERNEFGEKARENPEIRNR